MKHLTIILLCLLTSCTTIIVEPGADAGPGFDAGSTMPDGFTLDSDPTDAPIRYDVGNDATPTMIEITVCDDAVSFDSASNFCRAFYSVLSQGPCADQVDRTEDNPSQQEIRCPWIDFLQCRQCDFSQLNECVQALSEVGNRPSATCQAVLNERDNNMACAYTACGWYE